MLPKPKIAVIINPHSAGGRTGRNWPEMARQLEERVGPVVQRFTERQGHATLLTRELLGEGFDIVAGVGGDGTFNEIANGFINVDEPVNPAACMAIIPAGTGGDFQRMFGFTSRDRTGHAIEIIAAGEPVEIDVGKVRYVSADGAKEERYFVNLVSFGMGGAVAARAKNFLTPFGGRLAFLWATFRVLLSYRGREVTVTAGEQGFKAPIKVTNVAVGNGCFHGGGMYPCPAARLDDGILEVTVIEYMNMVRLLRDIRVLYDGNIFTHPKVHALRGDSVSADATAPTLIEVDGEPLGRLPLEITLLPRKLRVLMDKSKVSARRPANSQAR
ncbi:MAG: diacylglycerol kinase family lipid kinase [Acidobacteriota bacterium]|nr:diacylglycerol kinase family lipid kinase [Acidobacteriota bacterium]